MLNALKNKAKSDKIKQYVTVGGRALKKRFLMVGMLVLSLFCFGCEKTIELTDEENYLIAEYSADLLMKYSKNIDMKYYLGEDALSVSSETDATEETTEITTTEEVTEETTEEITTEVTPSTNPGDDVPDNTTEYPPEDMVDVDDKDTTVSQFDIASHLGVSDVKIYYDYYMLLDSYPTFDKNGVYVTVDAPDGYKLLVLKFDIENQKNSVTPVNLYDKDINYKIIVNKTRSANQLLTLLMDDLYTYEKDLQASELDKAVLVFQISDDVATNITDLKLSISINGNSKTMQLDQ